MRRALESREAKCIRMQELATKIMIARGAMQLPPVNLKRATFKDVERIWRETVSAARAKGLIE